MNQKFLKLAKFFTRAIQDELNYDQVNDSLIFGQLIRTEEEIQAYLNNASNIYFNQIAKENEFRPERIVISYPELLNYLPITVLANQKEATHTRKNIYKLLSGANYEAIDNGFIPKILQSDSYFRNKAAICFDANKIYYFPAPISDTNLTVYYVRYPLQNDGTGFGFNTAEDIVWNETHFADIVQIAVKLYRVDDFQEDL